MDKTKKIVSTSSSSSSSSSFDHIFGPRVSSSPSSSTTGLFKSIFPPPSAGMLGRQKDFASQGGHATYQSPNERGERSKKKEKKSYQNEETEPPCNLSSSIYYGGQEKYSSTRTTTKDTYKKDGEEADSKSASRGNWWEGIVFSYPNLKVYLIDKGRFITNMHCMSCNPDFEQLLREVRDISWSNLKIKFEGSLCDKK